MKPSPALPALVFVLTLTQCDRPQPPAAAPAPPKTAATPENEAQLTEWRDALARQAVEFGARSALLDKQLADMEKKLQLQENEALRGQLDSMKQQNDALRSQADSSRRQSEAITQRLTVSAPVVAPVVPRDYSIFYDRLTPHGRWLDVGGYGRCFQPRVAKTRSWRPYVDGCWGWTSLGWTWQSNEPFGWATYHYGRWLELTGHGWIWVPGSEWAPAWVAWRQSSNHVGWAPLPPERGVCSSVQRDCDSRYGLGPASYTFINTTNFVRPTYATICHPVSYNTTIFRHTVNITQIVPCGGRDRTQMYMHHGGPPRHHIEQTCRQTVPQPQIRQIDPVTIASLPATTPRPFTQDAIGVIQLPPASARPRLPDIPAADRILQPQIADGFRGMPQTVRTEIQQGITEEKNRVASADSPQPAAPSPRPALLPAMATLTAAPPVTPSPVMAEIERPNTLPPATTPAVQITPLPAAQQPLIADLPRTTAAESPSPAPLVTSPLGTPVVPQTIPEMPVTAAEPAAVSPIGPPAASPPAAETTPAQPVIAESTPGVPPAVETTTPTGPDPAIQQQAEAAAMAQKQSEEAARTAVEQETQRQQDEAAAMAQKQTADAARAASEQEAQRQQAEAAAMQQQRQAEDAARQQAEAAAMQQRQAEEAARATAEQEAQRRAQEEQMRQAQAEAQRQAEEAARRAQEEAARRAQEEAMRQAQAEAQRQAEEAARRAQEEAARRAQEEAQREAQRQAAEAAQRAAEEAARRAAEESAHQAAEAAQRAAEAARPPQP